MIAAVAAGLSAVGTQGSLAQGVTDKEIVIGIRQRGGDLRLFHSQDAKSGTLAKFIRENISTTVSVIITDDASAYPPAIAADPLYGDYRGKHKTVKHSAGVYVAGDIHTNTIESAFSLLKRGIMGSFHHVSVKHLNRYCDEFSFRWNHRGVNDGRRTIAAIKGAEGKRLMYKTSIGR